MDHPKYQVHVQSDFFFALKKEVFDLLGKEYKTKANKPLAVKGFLLILFFLGVLVSMWFHVFHGGMYIFLSIILGISCLPLILNVGHESIHRNFSTHSSVNKLGEHVFYLLGTSPYFWKLRHNSSHHAFANIKGWDLDIDQSEIIRLSSHQKFKRIHKYQHIYMPFAFCFYTISWFFIRDFKDIRRSHFGSKHIERHAPGEIIKLIIAKTWHITSLLVIPYVLSQDMALVLLGFLSFHLSASIITTFALISTHVGEPQEVMDISNDKGKLPYSWAVHQLKTTADFSTNSTAMLHFFGGFNHHVAHHLFPRVPHIYYPIITPIIKKHVSKNGLCYHSNSNLFKCTISHFKRLKDLSMEV